MEPGDVGRRSILQEQEQEQDRESRQRRGCMC
jgi:hypothetical protein